MKLVLAEKPSVARSLATVLGCFQKNEGYIEGKEYIVTWALGHLVQLSQPATYGSQYKRWSLASLPILPKKLQVEPIERTLNQFKIVKSLLERDDFDSFIIATDAGREGELVARWILELSSYNKKIQRLWISSQTDEAIKDGFLNLKDGDDYLNLFKAAECRSWADWYIGMNVTRALTCHYDAKMSAGRVQTPTLAIMCKREDEIEAFTGKFYWTLKGDFGSFNASYYPIEDSIRIEEEKQLIRAKEECLNQVGYVESLETVLKSEQPPLAYDLTQLQRDANIELGFSAKKTLEVLQKLYETHKIVTYPRTDSRYITHDIVPTLKNRLKALKNTPFYIEARNLINNEMRIDEERFVKDELVSDHHAIIPTEQFVNLDRLNNDEKELWQLIVVRFLEVLECDYEYKTTTVIINVNNNRFKSRLTIGVKQGFKDVSRIINKRNSVSSLDSENNFSLSSLKEGDKLALKSLQSRKLTTEAPSRYNDATLLSAMEHAGRFVDDAKLKRNLSAGLGTPATRADIIEKLIFNNYIERNTKNELIPTPRGREIVRLAPSMLQSPELTGQWEDRLSKISKGKEDPEKFISDIKECARNLVEKVSQTHDSFNPSFEEGKKCPYCNSQMMKIIAEDKKTHYICQKLSCSYEEMEVKKRVALSAREIEEKKKLFKKDNSKKKAVVVKKVVKVAVKKKTVSSKVKTAANVSSSAAYFSSLAKSTTIPSSKQKILLKKDSQLNIPSYKYETVIEVVRESKLNRRYKNNNNKNEDRIWKNNKSKVEFGSNDGGGTFADFIKASEDRKKRNKRK